MKVSIVTPAYNAAASIEAAVASVQAQTLTDWELLIVNDGSTDGTGAILDRLDDPRIRVFHQANAGASAARNRGLEVATGTYVTFLDADDILPPNALEIRADFLDASPSVDIVNGGIRVTSDGSLLRRYTPGLGEGPLVDRLALLDEEVFFGPFYMLRRERIGMHRFPEGISHCEDMIFFLTLAHDAGLIYGAVPEDVYEYRVNPGSAMSNFDGIEAGYLELLRRTACLDKLAADVRAYQARRVARILFRSWLRKGHPLRALAARRKVFRVAQS